MIKSSARLLVKPDNLRHTRTVGRGRTASRLMQNQGQGNPIGRPSGQSPAVQTAKSGSPVIHVAMQDLTPVFQDLTPVFRVKARLSGFTSSQNRDRTLESNDGL